MLPLAYECDLMKESMDRHDRWAQLQLTPHTRAGLFLAEWPEAQVIQETA